MGYDVSDYTLGKADWLAAGLPTVREQPGPERAHEAMTRDVETCPPGELVGEVRRRASGDDVYVLNAERVLLGRVRLSRADDDTVTAEQAMHPGPTTVRADEDARAARERMHKRSVRSLAVTTPDGVLLGVLHADPPA